MKVQRTINFNAYFVVSPSATIILANKQVSDRYYRDHINNTTRTYFDNKLAYTKYKVRNLIYLNTPKVENFYAPAGSQLPLSALISCELLMK